MQITQKQLNAVMMRCCDCGSGYRHEDETRIDGQPLGLCPDCADDYDQSVCDGTVV